MDKSELLAELDTYLALREPEELLTTKTLSTGYTINVYQVKGVETRTNDRMNPLIIQFWVYREGEPQELAYYEGDPIESFWRNKVLDYIAQWDGEIIRSRRPLAICRIIESAAEGEKWVLITETAPDTYTKEDTTIKEVGL